MRHHRLQILAGKRGGRIEGRPEGKRGGGWMERERGQEGTGRERQEREWRRGDGREMQPWK
jgi:hypothetical protein